MATELELSDIYWLFENKPTLAEAAEYLGYGGEHSHSPIDDYISRLDERAIQGNLWSLIVRMIDGCFFKSWEELLYITVAYLNTTNYAPKITRNAIVDFVDYFNGKQPQKNFNEGDFTPAQSLFIDLVYYHVQEISSQPEFVWRIEEIAPGLVQLIDLQFYWASLKRYCYPGEVIAIEVIHEAALTLPRENFVNVLKLYPKWLVDHFLKFEEEGGIFAEYLPNSYKVKRLL